MFADSAEKRAEPCVHVTPVCVMPVMFGPVLPQVKIMILPLVGVKDNVPESVAAPVCEKRPP